jgi:hypothetical protein
MSLVSGVTLIIRDAMLGKTLLEFERRLGGCNILRRG